ncbi:MAG: hypothetical protein JW840_07895 [Candidatus Thermoplasmatota archaeon]|nr:hypothetical protein [Candidatus Thermoplasmatota archaeon]
MMKKPVLVVSLCAVVLLVLGSLSNVVGYQTVQTSQQNLIKERINQRELLFQTICDIANNKEIQRIILKSEMSRGISPPSEIPVVTKSQLRVMYLLGVLLSRFTLTSRLQSMVGKYQFDNQEMQKEISTVIEKDTILNAEITQLKDSDCDCEYQRVTGLWTFPVLCLGLYFIFLFFLVQLLLGIRIMELFAGLFAQIGINMNCFWTHSYF